MDLRREDFRIEDNRKPQPITFFSMQDGQVADAPPSGSDAVGYAMIVLDWLNTKYSDRVQAKEQVLRLLKRFQPQQEVAVYVLSHEPYLLSSFTSDMQADAVDTVGLQPEDMGDEAPGRFDARYGGLSARKVSVEERLFDMTNRITDTVRGFQWIATNLARVKGRKSLIWVSAGFPVVSGRR